MFSFVSEGEERGEGRREEEDREGGVRGKDRGGGSE